MGNLCEVCNADISKRTARAKFCEKCAEDVKKEQVKKHYKKNKYVTPICIKCGEELINANRNTKYCKPCRAETRRKGNAEKLDNRVCKTDECNASLKGTHPNTKYCTDCSIGREAAARKRSQNKRYVRKTTRRNQGKSQGRDKDSIASKLLERIGKPKSATERCY